MNMKICLLEVSERETFLEVSTCVSRIASIMRTIERELDRVLTLLRNKIRERGFTQLEVQEALGWGRSYISQLLTKQKSLRIEQVLLILNVIGVDPGHFFSELYHFPAPGGTEGSQRYRPYGGANPFESGGVGSDEELQRNFGELQSLMRGLVRLLTSKGLVEADELSVAVSVAHNDTDIDDF